MPERASVFESVQIGVETTPGTAVPALKRLLATSIALQPVVPVNMFRPQGSKYNTTAIKQKESATGDINGVIAYNDIVYLLSSLLERAAISTPGGGTLSRQWLFNPAVFGPDVSEVYTLEVGSSAGAERATFAWVNGLTLRFTPEEASVTGDLMAQELQEGILLSTSEVQTITITGGAGTFTVTFGGQTTGALAYNAAASVVQAALEALSSIGSGNVSVSGANGGPYTVTFIGQLAQQNVAQMTGLGAGGATFGIATATGGVAPTDIAEVPVDPDTVSVYVGATVGGLVKLTRCLEAEWAMTNRFTPLFTLDDAEDSYSAQVERAPDFSARIVVQHNTIAQGFMTNLRAKDTRFCRIVCTGPVIEGSIPYKIQITFPFKFREPSRGDNDDVFATTFELAPVYDSGFGGVVEVVVTNTLAAL
jgi:hypothetical protein